MKSYFPDINVWLALTYRGHHHHTAAARWFDRMQNTTACFCRFTQLGFLRLLTYSQVMRDDVRTPPDAWKAYDQLISDSRVIFCPEFDPDAIQTELRGLTTTTRSAPQQWPNAYLAAFAYAEDLVLVTFDQALSKLTRSQVLLLK
jgi:uncharacterized protein